MIFTLARWPGRMNAMSRGAMRASISNRSSSGTISITLPLGGTTPPIVETSMFLTTPRTRRTQGEPLQRVRPAANHRGKRFDFLAHLGEILLLPRPDIAERRSAF